MNHKMRCRLHAAHLAAAILGLVLGGRALAADGKTFDGAIRPFLAKHCFACHGENADKTRLRLDKLPAEFSAKEHSDSWAKVLEKLRAGAMPPKKKPQPAPADSKQVQEWIHGGLFAADEARQKAEGRVVLRRLNRAEYQNSIRDLLAVDTELKDLLPADESAGGFDNNADALRISSILMERYLEAADLALDAAIVSRPKPETIKKRFSLKDVDGIKRQSSINLIKDDGVVLFIGSNSLPTVFRDLRAREEGRYRIRISAYAYQSDKPVSMRLYGGDVTGRFGSSRLVGHYDVPPGTPDKPTVIEVVDRMLPGDSSRVLPDLGSGDEMRRVGAANYKGPGLCVQWMEIEGPVFDVWPPESHQRLFGALPLKPVAGAESSNPRMRLLPGAKLSPTHVVTSKEPARDAERIIREFLPKAFRRPATEEEAKLYIGLVKSRLDQGYDFEEAVRVGLKAVLCAPDFLFLKEKPGRLDAFALASRLSYFLWSSPPDKALLDFAAKGTLTEAEVLRSQVERMLRDPKARRFTENFVGQWLDLREIDFTTPDRQLYPEFDEHLKVAMVKETELFFEEVLKNDLSLLNFVDADFSILNERLAQHYGIPGITGEEFRKVKLPPASGRGGVLTQASVLKVTANGTTTSPVVRGTWILKNILGRPAPPPPPNVPALEPDIRGAVTIREQLAKHRQDASCASCHNKIDPPGFALEGFDAIGGRRDFYRAIGGGQPIDLTVHGRRVRYRQGPSVDASGELADGKKFTHVAEFKKLLLADKDQIARCLTEKLLVYSTGGGIRLADQPAIDEIVQRARDKNFGLRSLIHEVVQSRIFVNK